MPSQVGDPDQPDPPQPAWQVVNQTSGVVDILVARHAAVNRLAEQISQGKLSVLAAPRIAKMLGDEIAQTESFIQLSYENEAAIRGDP